MNWIATNSIVTPELCDVCLCAKYDDEGDWVYDVCIFEDNWLNTADNNNVRYSYYDYWLPIHHPIPWKGHDNSPQATTENEKDIDVHQMILNDDCFIETLEKFKKEIITFLAKCVRDIQ